MLRCCDCHREFEEEDLEYVQTTWEEYYGVYNEFNTHTPMSYCVCPYCGNEDYEEVEDELSEDDEEAIDRHVDIEGITEDSQESK